MNIMQVNKSIVLALKYILNSKKSLYNLLMENKVLESDYIWRYFDEECSEIKFIEALLDIDVKDEYRELDDKGYCNDWIGDIIFDHSCGKIDLYEAVKQILNGANEVKDFYKGKFKGDKE